MIGAETGDVDGDVAGHVLDAQRFPLWGSRLIEASAGTGKTWTIAALYLRLVLGHGEGSLDGISSTAFERPLMPPDILVMTFTARGHARAVRPHTQAPDRGRAVLSRRGRARAPRRLPARAARGLPRRRGS